MRHGLPVAALLIVVTGVGAGFADAGACSGSGTRGTVLRLSQPPYAAVNCPGGNFIACDRVSVAAWVEGRPLSLTATIAGRRIVMRRPSSSSRDGYWEGTLRHAGAAPSRAPSHHPGQWPREMVWPPFCPVFIRSPPSYRTRPDATVGVRVLLRPGWG